MKEVTKMSKQLVSNDSNEPKERKTWTIRKIDNETIERTKAAASKSGMKIGAWVDQKLQQAAIASLKGSPDTSSDLAKELTQITDLLDNVSNKEILSRMSKIESEFTQIIKGPVSYTHLTLPTIYSV